MDIDGIIATAMGTGRKFPAGEEEKQQAKRMREDPEYRERRLEIDRAYLARKAEAGLLQLQTELERRSNDHIPGP